MISQVTIILWGKIYTPVMPCEAKYTLLELFCHQPNMIGWTGHMTSLDSVTVSVDCDICKWVSLMDKQCYAFSAGKLLAASSMHCVSCRLNLNLCFFTYCTCHMIISTSCVWLKGWFNPLCLLQSIAISRTHSNPTPNKKMHKQHTCVAYKWAYYLCRHLCLRSDVI